MTHLAGAQGRAAEEQIIDIERKRTVLPKLLLQRRRFGFFSSFGIFSHKYAVDEKCLWTPHTFAMCCMAQRIIVRDPSADCFSADTDSQLRSARFSKVTSLALHPHHRNCKNVAFLHFLMSKKYLSLFVLCSKTC